MRLVPRWPFLLSQLVVAVPALALESLTPGMTASAEVGVAVPNPADVPSGLGFRVRVGYQFGSGVTPEAVFSHASWGSNDGPRGEQTSLFQGIRWTVGFNRLHPWIAAYLGMSQVRWLPAGGLDNRSVGPSGLTGGVAGGLDVRLLGDLGVGLHLNYTRAVRIESGFAGWLEVLGALQFGF